ncbi:THO complex subunit 4-like [Melanaphis sacchari]|uniref:THO complex subunit 4-like n=1 Tax=Melanaphis sacchari TaxID=742174 RepID=UPI000DC145FE|nr:THO complex subunit 4-like [Melanaphis sacchari]
MDLSLDEIIKSKRSTSRDGHRGDEGQGGSRGGGIRRDGGGLNFRSNGVIGGGEGPMRRNRPMARRSNGFNPYSWTRDMYEGPKRQQMRGGLSTTNIHKIIISNLDFGVTSKDIQELFDEFGPLKTATVHYDTSGRSLGIADVVFDSKNAALKAVHQYNNVRLDGRPMKIKLATELSTVANLATRPSKPVSRGNTRGRGEDARDDRGNSRGNTGGQDGSSGRGDKNNEEKMPNKDELDAELDAFMKSKIKEQLARKISKKN